MCNPFGFGSEMKSLWTLNKYCVYDTAGMAGGWDSWKMRPNDIYGIRKISMPYSDDRFFNNSTKWMSFGGSQQAQQQQTGWPLRENRSTTWPYHLLFLTNHDSLSFRGVNKMTEMWSDWRNRVLHFAHRWSVDLRSVDGKYGPWNVGSVFPGQNSYGSWDIYRTIQVRP